MTPCSTKRRITIGAACVAAAWSLQGIAEDVPGAKGGDEAMTCEQIAAELAPYAQQMSGTMNPLMQTQQEVLERAQVRQTEAATTAAAVTAGAIASSADPTGAASRTYGQAEVQLQQQAWNRAMTEDKPLQDRYAQQANGLAAQAAMMQSNPRLQRLMSLAQQKNCH